MFFLFSGREEERDAGEGAGEGTHSEGKTSPLYYMTLLHIDTKFLYKESVERRLVQPTTTN